MNIYFLQLTYKIKHEPEILLLLNFYKRKLFFLEQNNENIKYSLKIEISDIKEFIKKLNKIKHLIYVITNNNIFYLKQNTTNLLIMNS